MATPAAPNPWSRRSCTRVPPAEWPIRMGGDSSSPTTASRCSTTAGTVSASIGEVSALSASTSTLESRISRRDHAVAGLLVSGDPVLPASGSDPEAMDQNDRVRCCRIRAHTSSLLAAAAANRPAHTHPRLRRSGHRGGPPDSTPRFTKCNMSLDCSSDFNGSLAILTPGRSGGATMRLGTVMNTSTPSAQPWVMSNSHTRPCRGCRARCPACRRPGCRRRRRRTSSRSKAPRA